MWVFLLSGTVIAVTGVAILAQSGTSADWISLLVNLGGFGVLTWVVHHLFTKAVPTAMADFKEVISMLNETINSQRADHIKLLDQQRAEHAQVMHAQCIENAAVIREQREAFERIVMSQAKSFHEELQMERNAYRELMAELRGAVRPA